MMIIMRRAGSLQHRGGVHAPLVALVIIGRALPPRQPPGLPRLLPPQLLVHRFGELPGQQRDAAPPLPGLLILTLLRHAHVPGVPQDPEGQADEDDDGAGVDQEVPVEAAVQARVREDPDEEHHQAGHVQEHGHHERGHAASDARDHLHVRAGHRGASNGGCLRARRTPGGRPRPSSAQVNSFPDSEQSSSTSHLNPRAWLFFLTTFAFQIPMHHGKPHLSGDPGFFNHNNKRTSFRSGNLTRITVKHIQIKEKS